MDENFKKTLSPGKALAKSMKYCAIQERCQQDVFNKLIEWGVDCNTAENIICTLIEEKFIDEERFAKAFAKGKFNINKWGKTKIKYELKLKNISENCIKLGLSIIDEEMYIETLKSLILKKKTELKENNLLILKKKLINYALSKGYENDLVYSQINRLFKIN